MNVCTCGGKCLMCILSRYGSQRLYVPVSVYVHVCACICSQRLMCICDCVGGTYGRG